MWFFIIIIIKDFMNFLILISKVSDLIIYTLILWKEIELQYLITVIYIVGSEDKIKFLIYRIYLCCFSRAYPIPIYRIFTKYHNLAFNQSKTWCNPRSTSTCPKYTLSSNTTYRPNRLTTASPSSRPIPSNAWLSPHSTLSF